MQDSNALKNQRSDNPCLIVSARPSRPGYIVKLEAEQRGGLEQLISSGQAPARKLMHARILLKADSGEDGPNWSETRISEALEVSLPTIWRVRLLAERLVKVGEVQQVSNETVRQVLKKTNSSHG